MFKLLVLTVRCLLPSESSVLTTFTAFWRYFTPVLVSFIPRKQDNVVIHLPTKFLSSNNSTLFQFAFAWCSGAIAMAAVGKYPTSVQFLSTGSSPAPSTSAVTPNVQVPPPPSPKPAAEPLAVGAPPCTQTVLDALNSNPQLSKTASIAIASGTLWTNCHVIAYHCIFACPGGS